MQQITLFPYLTSMRQKTVLITILVAWSVAIHAATYYGNPSNYTTFLTQLMPGDTLILSHGDYTDRLNLRDVNGTKDDPIVISGAQLAGMTRFLGHACCNTVSLIRSSFVIIEHLVIDGQNISFIDAVKAEGHQDNWCHDITLRHLTIINHGPEQQTNGISTKCPSWNWHIHHNVIIGAGTGMYLGNSNGEEPFVNGIVEFNLIMNTTGYNMQIKRQNNGSRDSYNIPDTSRTIIRYNVFSKAENASSGGNARPNLLVGGLPTEGHGTADHYEIYGNFFYQNPTEGLFQGTGNVAFYDNVLYNDLGGWGVAILEHHGKKPQNIDIFHNTVAIENGKSVSFFRPDAAFTQRVVGNALFSDQRVSGATEIRDNLEADFSEAEDYLKDPYSGIPGMDCSPKGSALEGSLISSSPFEHYTNAMRDFDGKLRTWTVRGAYADAGSVEWPLDLAIRPDLNITTSNELVTRQDKIRILQNPVADKLQLVVDHDDRIQWRIVNNEGRVMRMGDLQGNTSSHLIPLDVESGMYYLQTGFQNLKFVVIRK